jgi:hypothetical protein
LVSCDRGRPNVVRSRLVGGVANTSASSGGDFKDERFEDLRALLGSARGELLGVRVSRIGRGQDDFVLLTVARVNGATRRRHGSVQQRVKAGGPTAAAR